MIKEVGHSEQGTDDEGSITNAEVLGSITNAEVLGEMQWEDIVCFKWVCSMSDVRETKHSSDGLIS